MPESNSVPTVTRGSLGRLGEKVDEQNTTTETTAVRMTAINVEKGRHHAHTRTTAGDPSPGK